MTISFKPSFNIPINSVIIMFDDNINMLNMAEHEGVWTAYVNLNEGNYNYRLLVNNRVFINDPTANMYILDRNNVVWSVLTINENGERIYNNEIHTVNVETYSICDNIYENDLILTNKKKFNIKSDKMTALRFEFTNVTGIHSADIMWINPASNIFDVSNSALCKSNKESIIIWFCLNYIDKATNYMSGIWTAILLIDGKYILEDKFEFINDVKQDRYLFNINV